MAIVLNGNTGITNVDGTAGAPAEKGTTSSTAGVFFPAANTVAISTNSTEALRIDAFGNVGIGTATPNANTGTALVLYSTNTPRFRLTNSTTGQAASDGSEISLFSTGELIIENRESAATIFYNGGSERMRIKSDGTIWCGGSSFPAGTTGQINSLNTAGTPFAGYVNTTGGYAQIYFNNPNGAVGQIYTTGSTTTYATSSDYRLKHDVQPVITGLATVAALKPVTYKWNADESDGEGFIAHELQEVIPHAVAGEKDAVNEDGSIKPQGVDYSKIVVHLVAACQELKAQNDELKARVAALEGK